MANAWILAPLTPSAVTTAGTLQLGQGAYAFNDFAGVVVQLACDAATNQAYVQLDLGADMAIDTLMVFGVGLIPPAATLSVMYATAAQGAFSGTFTTDTSGSVYAGTAAMASGAGVSLWSVSNPVTARYVRIAYIGTVGGQAVRLARIVLGKRIAPQRNFAMGAAHGVRDLGSLDFSARGVLLRRRAKKLRTIGLTFSNFTKDEVEQLTKPLLEQIGNTEMVAVITDPAPHAQRQNRSYFGALVGDLANTQRNAAGWEVKANLVSLF